MTPATSRAPGSTIPRLRGRWNVFAFTNPREADRIQARVDDGYLDRKGLTLLADLVDAGDDDALVLALARCAVAELLTERLGAADDYLATRPDDGAGRAE